MWSGSRSCWLTTVSRHESCKITIYDLIPAALAKSTHRHSSHSCCVKLEAQPTLPHSLHVRHQRLQLLGQGEHRLLGSACIAPCDALFVACRLHATCWRVSVLPRYPVHNPPQVRPKLEKDPRWALLPSNKERRAVFEDFCKQTGQAQKAQKAASEKAAVEGFKALLEEALTLERRVAAEMEAAAAAAAEEEQQLQVEADAQAALARVEEGEVPLEGGGAGSKGGEATAAGSGGAAADGQAGSAGGSKGGGCECGEDMEVEDGERDAAVNGQQQGGGGGGAAQVNAGPGAPRDAAAIGEDELEGLSYDQLERYWAEDERWRALGDVQRRQLADARFGAALAAGAERREVRKRDQHAVCKGWLALCLKRAYPRSLGLFPAEVSPTPFHPAHPAGRQGGARHGFSLPAGVPGGRQRQPLDPAGRRGGGAPGGRGAGL